MAATFVVEDGTGMSTANSYLSVEDADQYWDDHAAPAAWTGATTSAKQEALRMATQYLDNKYGQRWKGVAVRETQSLDWPRFDVLDYNEYVVPSNAVPRQVRDATAEAALRHINEKAAGGSLMPDVSNDGMIQSESSSIGPLSRSVTYTGGKSQLKRYTVVDEALRDVILPTGTMISRG